MKNWQLEPFYFAPQRKPCGGWVAYKDSPSPPAAPDYTGAANATSQGSVQAALVNNLLNLRNTYTPLGSQTFNQTGTTTVPGVGTQPAFDIPTYSQNVSMTPEGKNLYDKQMGISTSLLDVGQNSLDQTKASLGKPQDMQSVQDIADQSYANQTSRLDPQWAANTEANDAQLANQGIMQGSEAYDNAKRTFGQAKNDAYTQARQAAISTMPQTFQLSTAERMQPLTELNAIRTGAQPQMPQFQGVAPAGGAQGPNLLGAAQATSGYNQGLYNSQVGQDNAMMQGLFGLGGAAMNFGGPAMAAWSDRRLKSGIQRIGTHRLGIGIYRYAIGGHSQVGVMADEVEQVMPAAVVTMPSGFQAVNYGMLNG